MDMNKEAPSARSHHLTKKEVCQGQYTEEERAQWISEMLHCGLCAHKTTTSPTFGLSDSETIPFIIV